VATNPFGLTQFGVPTSFLNEIGMSQTEQGFGKDDPKRKIRDIAQELYGLGKFGLGQRLESRAPLVPGYSQVFEQAQQLGQGLTPEEKSAIQQEALGALGSSFESARGRAENLAARTRNRAA
jgi:hypothetical protein